MEAALDKLKPHPKNYNLHSEAQIARLMSSLQRFGQPKEIVTWGGFVIAGHGLVEAARRLKLSTLRAQDMTGKWTETEALAFLAADNELGRLGDPDEAALAALVLEISGVDEQLACLAAGTEERLAEMSAASLRDVNPDGTDGRRLGTPTLIRLVVDVIDVGTVERAIAAADELNRGKAIMIMCREFLRAKGQLDGAAEGVDPAELA